MRAGDEVRINVQLIEGAADRHLWADMFDRKLENVLALHLDVARAIAREIIKTGHPLRPPACILSGGETTVTLKGTGRGGRNQEFALAAAIDIAGSDTIVVLSAGTDGTDGPTDAAGAVSDTTTVSRAAALGLLRLAQCEFNAGQDQAALQLYSEVLARYPGTGIAREAERGMEVALYRLGQSEEGGQVLSELVEQYPTSAFAADAQFEIAMRRYDAREFEAAAEEFRRVVSQFPSYSAADRAHFLMAESYHQAGQVAEARNGYEQFLMFFPESEFQLTVRFKLGTIRFVEGDYMQAAIDFSTVLEEEAPEEIERASLFNLALCKKMIGDLEGPGPP